ncbi:hypothetical protein AB205_0057100 [Aquarana catesbeiana]|uniref:Uncharacterized protein n=1 Tax=Aquarana catesbeiana TaxID=8400 RepID=A0A2G9PTT1_AQUCT|nr:hypothetical protein AB205_0057100 [Aquarana catesbeiana]
MTRSLLPSPMTQSLLSSSMTRSLLPSPMTRSLLPSWIAQSLLPSWMTQSLMPSWMTQSLKPSWMTQSLLPSWMTQSLLPSPMTQSLLPSPMIRSPRYELGTALFIGWAGSVLCLIGGFIFCCTFPFDNVIQRSGYRYATASANSIHSMTKIKAPSKLMHRDELSQTKVHQSTIDLNGDCLSSLQAYVESCTSSLYPMFLCGPRNCILTTIKVKKRNITCSVPAPLSLLKRESMESRL